MELHPQNVPKAYHVPIQLSHNLSKIKMAAKCYKLTITTYGDKTLQNLNEISAVVSEQGCPQSQVYWMNGQLHTQTLVFVCPLPCYRRGKNVIQP